MSNRKLIRRTFLAATLTISGAHVTAASGFQQGQYQPGQPGTQIPQGNSKVTQELNRMFQENGQQMPSMNAKDLPNANVATQGQIQPIHTPNQLQVNTISANHEKSKQNGSSGKQGVLGRFFGKLRGDTGNSGDTGNNDPDYRPPVPPESTHPSAQFQNGAASPIPPRSGAPVRATNANVPALPTQGAAGQRIEYTQPGSAPGFMSTAGAATVIQKQPLATPSSRAKYQTDFSHDSQGAIEGTRQNAETTTPKAVVKSPVADEFEVPFEDSAESFEETETLDLDSLIEIPAAAPQPFTSTAKEPNPAKHGSSEATRAAQVPAGSASAFVDSTSRESGEETVPGVPGDNSVEAPEENPFTGVQLNASDSQFFERQGLTDGVDADAFGDPAAPMEDFSSDLPAINSPSVNLPPVDDEADFELIETPAAESIQQSVDDSDAMRSDIPETMSAAETARLRQTAEQERRQFQQRQIQVRAGQTGFKGFCPVALRERRELADSSDQFTSTFGLQTYKFSSAESKAAFDLDPSRYAPAAGGSDVVVLVNSGEEQAGQLDYALWYRDRLYLFRSRETMTLFSKDPQRFASQY